MSLFIYWLIAWRRETRDNLRLSESRDRGEAGHLYICYAYNNDNKYNNTNNKNDRDNDNNYNNDNKNDINYDKNDHDNYNNNNYYYNNK